MCWEVGMLAPKRREIGHGRLARRALESVVPGESEFPYVIRLVSEITESMGQAQWLQSVAALAMMAGGVPIKAPVAGIAMGLVKIGENYKVLSDISGDEDHFGHMDFKVAGTKDEVTALQMDIKINGITRDILKEALAQAKEGRLHILNEMSSHIAQPEEDVSRFAPRMISLKIHPDKIRDVIGKGGATIREITEKFDVSIDITDDGTVKINAVDADKGEAARQHIKEMTADLEKAKYMRQDHQDDGFLKSCGIFTARQRWLLAHFSNQQWARWEHSDILSEDQVITVKVVEIDRQGRVKVSMKDL